MAGGPFSALVLSSFLVCAEGPAGRGGEELGPVRFAP
jgi:hypothetical protein